MWGAGGQIDPTTFEALWGPYYAPYIPTWNVDQCILIERVYQLPLIKIDRVFAWRMDFFQNFPKLILPISAQAPAKPKLQPSLLITFSKLVHNFFMTYSRLAHDLFTTCLWLVPDMLITCSWLVHYLFMSCSWLVHDLFITCSWLARSLFSTC